MIGIGQRIGQLTVAMSKIGGGAGIVVPPPAIPILTAPANLATVNIGVAVTVSATTTDAILSRMDWILDPSGAAIVVASDTDGAPYTQSWVPSTTIADHTLIARAVRGAQSTDSAPITIHVAAGAPAVPTLTAPAANAALFNGIAVTVSATTTDTPTRIDWVLDGVTVVATDSVAPYSQSWTPAGITPGSHTLVARAVGPGGSTDSPIITVTVDALWPLIASVTTLRAWQTDFGVTMGGTPLASGATPPVVTLTGAVAITPALRIEVQTTGSDGVATFRYGAQNTGSTSTAFIESGKVVPAGGGAYAAIGALAGLTFNFPAGAYTNNNVYQGTCSAWTCQVSGAVAAAASAAAQPRILLGLGNRIKLVFDGIDDLLVEPVLDRPAPGTSPTSIRGALAQLTWSNNTALWGGNGGFVLFRATATPRCYALNVTFGTNWAALALGSTGRIRLRFSNAAGDTIRFAATTGTGNGGNTDPTAGWSFGGNVGASQFANCEVYNHIISVGEPSPTEDTNIDAAMSAMYPTIGV